MIQESQEDPREWTSFTASFTTRKGGHYFVALIARRELKSFCRLYIFQVNTFISSAFKASNRDLKHLTAHDLVAKSCLPA